MQTKTEITSDDRKGNETRVMSLPDDAKSLTMCAGLDTTSQRDGQTDAARSH